MRKPTVYFLKLLVEEGDQVEVSQLMFEIDPKQIKSPFNGVKADVDGAIVDPELTEQRSSNSWDTIFNYQ